VSAESATPETPPETPLRVPAHGNGRLRTGGTNRGGPGRPPAEVRAASRDVYSGDGIRQLRRILRSRTARDADKVAAATCLARFGGVERLELDSGPGLLEQLILEAASGDSDPEDASRDLAGGVYVTPQPLSYPPVPIGRGPGAASGQTPEPADSPSLVPPHSE
jgi:hypothetical protein